MSHRAAGLVGLLSVVAGVAPTGCVVYRDRIVTVGQRVEVEVQNGASATATAAVTPAPVRLDSAAMHLALDRYGAWRDHPAYGQIWEPTQESAGADFVPYGTRGEWVFTSAGWYWQSELAWGWVAFHYGRWVQLEERWAWVPGSTFAPAWVDWRYGSGWVGWSPLPPMGAPFTAPYAYCAGAQLAGRGLWGRVVYGPGAVSLYSRTARVAPACGYGGAIYAWGPPPARAGVIAPPAVPVERAWRDAPRDAQPRHTLVLSDHRAPPVRIPEVPAVAVANTPATGTVRSLDTYPAFAGPHPAVVAGLGWRPGARRTLSAGSSAPSAAYSVIPSVRVPPRRDVAGIVEVTGIPQAPSRPPVGALTQVPGLGAYGRTPPSAMPPPAGAPMPAPSVPSGYAMPSARPSPMPFAPFVPPGFAGAPSGGSYGPRYAAPAPFVPPGYGVAAPSQTFIAPSAVAPASRPAPFVVGGGYAPSAAAPRAGVGNSVTPTVVVPGALAVPRTF